MNISRYAGLSVLMLSLWIGTSVELAQAGPWDRKYEPLFFQPGKDVVWVPTGQELVDKMLAVAKVTSQDYVIDLGSGDGRTVISAAKLGARSLGIEYNPEMVALSKRNAANEGVADKAQFIQADLFETDISQATVLTLFLMPDINIRLRPKILNLKPGTRVVSNTFTMGEWAEDESTSVEDHQQCTFYCTAYLWIVPAKAGGLWKLPNGELDLRQDFQMVFGTLRYGIDIKPIINGRLTGDQISFTVGNATYTGRVKGDAMEGMFTSDGSTTGWSALKIGETLQTPK